MSDYNKYALLGDMAAFTKVAMADQIGRELANNPEAVALIKEAGAVQSFTKMISKGVSKEKAMKAVGKNFSEKSWAAAEKNIATNTAKKGKNMKLKGDKSLKGKVQGTGDAYSPAMKQSTQGSAARKSSAEHNVKNKYTNKSTVKNEFKRQGSGGTKGTEGGFAQLGGTKKPASKPASKPAKETAKTDAPANSGSKVDSGSTSGKADKVWYKKKKNQYAAGGAAAGFIGGAALAS